MHSSIAYLEVHLDYTQGTMRRLIESAKALKERTAENATAIVAAQAEIDNIKLAIETLRAADEV